MLNNCSFWCLVCNNVNMFENGKAPIALSTNEDFVFTHDKHAPKYTLHNHHDIIISYLMLMVMCQQRDTSWWMMYSSIMHTHCFCYLLCV
jgi:hypothetical protein